MKSNLTRAALIPLTLGIGTGTKIPIGILLLSPATLLTRSLVGGSRLPISLVRCGLSILVFSSSFGFLYQLAHTEPTITIDTVVNWTCLHDVTQKLWHYRCSTNEDSAIGALDETWRIQDGGLAQGQRGHQPFHRRRRKRAHLHRVHRRESRR